MAVYLFSVFWPISENKYSSLLTTNHCNYLRVNARDITFVLRIEMYIIPAYFTSTMSYMCALNCYNKTAFTAFVSSLQNTNWYTSMPLRMSDARGVSKFAINFFGSQVCQKCCLNIYIFFRLTKSLKWFTCLRALSGV